MRHNGSLFLGITTNNTAISGNVRPKANKPCRTAVPTVSPQSSAKHRLTDNKANSSHAPVSRLWLNNTAEPIRNNMDSSSTCQSRIARPSKAFSIIISSRKEMPPSRPMTVPNCCHTTAPAATSKIIKNQVGSLPARRYSSTKRNTSIPPNTAMMPAGSVVSSGNDAQTNASKTAAITLRGGICSKKAGFNISMEKTFP